MTKKNIAVAAALLAIIIAAVALRLIHFNDRYIVDLHSWRQADTAAFTHNYLNNGMNLFKPQIDRYPCRFRDVKDFGLVEAELPIVHYLAAVPLYAAGKDWPSAPYLRGVSVFFFALALIYLFLLVRRLLSDEEALVAALVFSTLPLSVFFTRTVQPDGPGIFFIVACYYYLDLWLVEGRKRHFFASVALGAGVVLIKISFAFFLAPAAYFFFWRRGFAAAFKRATSYMWLLMVVLPSVGWYSYAHRFPWTFGIWPGREGNKFSTLDGIIRDAPGWHTFTDRAAFEIFTWSGIVLLIVGFTLLKAKKGLVVFAVWFFSVLFFLLVAIVGNKIHNYYQLPFAAPGAVLIAAGAVAAWRSGWGGRVFLAVAAAVFFVTTQHFLLWHGANFHNESVYAQNAHFIDAIKLLNENVPKNEKFVTNEWSPTIYYNSGRLGYYTEEGTVIKEAVGCMRDDIRYLLLEAGGHNIIKNSKDLAAILNDNFNQVAAKGSYSLFIKKDPAQKAELAPLNSPDFKPEIKPHPAPKLNSQAPVVNPNNEPPPLLPPIKMKIPKEGEKK